MKELNFPQLSTHLWCPFFFFCKQDLQESAEHVDQVDNDRKSALQQLQQKQVQIEQLQQVSVTAGCCCNTSVDKSVIRSYYHYCW